LKHPDKLAFIVPVGEILMDRTELVDL